MRRIFSVLLICAAFGARGGGAPRELGDSGSPGVLVQYSFDDDLTDTGPDTFAVFQHAKGHVRLVSHIRYSGYRSIELHDVAGDGDFPELQGYFPERKGGELFFHFAMLVANPDQTLNVALAGPQHFTLTKDGIAFWLKTTGGILQQVSDSIPKRLFRVEPFVWYLVDLRYDIPRGVYDLTIHKEGEAEAVVALKDQPNAANAPGSSVDKFSFVGSVFEDDSNVTYYVDDVIIGTDEKVVPGPFVAPGRRKLFIDRWREAKLLMMKSPVCPPMLSLSDLGLRDDDIPLLRDRGGLEAMPAFKEWRSACGQLESDPASAATRFVDAERQYPNAPIFAISELMALVRAEQHDAALKRWQELEPLLQRDPRYGMVAAVAGMSSGDMSRAEQWLEARTAESSQGARASAEASPTEAGNAGSGLVENPSTSDERLIADQYYFVLLWKGDFRRAAGFAETMSKRSPDGDWLERTGDALFLSGATAEARPIYEEALRQSPGAYWPTTKLSDVFHLLGDAANEKLYRQKMYGRLEEGSDRP